MSSRVLGRAQHSEVRPVQWRQADGSPGESCAAPGPFQPAEVAASPESAALRSRLAEAEQAARLAVSEAHKKGLHEGEALGKAQALAALEPALDRMAKTARELCDLRPRLRRDAESDVVQLAIAVARRIIHRELSLDPGAMQALVQVALNRLDRQEIHRVVVHPSQAAAVQAVLAGETRQVEVVGDPKRDLGSLIFETNRGTLDASTGAQFEEIERGLTDRVNLR